MSHSRCERVTSGCRASIRAAIVDEKTIEQAGAPFRGRKS